MYYNVTTTERIEPLRGADLTGAEMPDTVGATSASGSTAQGGRDNFTFTGRITALTLTGGPARVFINGEPVDPATYRTTTPTSTPAPTSTPPTEPVKPVGLEPPLDGSALAARHAEALQAAGSFTANHTSTVRDPTADAPETDRRSAQANLAANTASQISHPTEEATRYTYAEGTRAYKKTVLDGFINPEYKVEELGRPLTESLISSTTIAETVRAVDYKRSGTITRDGRTLAVYVANGTDSVSTDEGPFRGENITAFSSTLILAPDTGIVHTLRTKRTTDYLSSGEPVTIVETLRFSAIGSTTVEQPSWVERLKDRRS